MSLMSIIASDLNSTAHARAHTPSCGGRRVPYEQDGAGQLQDLRPRLHDALLRHGRRPLARQPSQVQRGRVDQLDGDTSYLGRGQKGQKFRDNISRSLVKGQNVRARARTGIRGANNYKPQTKEYTTLSHVHHTHASHSRAHAHARHTHTSMHAQVNEQTHTGGGLHHCLHLHRDLGGASGTPPPGDPHPSYLQNIFWMCGVRRWWDICGQKEEESRM